VGSQLLKELVSPQSFCGFKIVLFSKQLQSFDQVIIKSLWCS
jgi:hypothetical protein